jgi:polyphosphate:AMP phosphotransferase
MAKSDLPPRISKKAYEARVAGLRARLVQMQVELKSAPFPVLLVIAGEEASGKGEVVNILNAWLDPRGVETFSFHAPTDEERERPAMWRYWRCLPPRGRMGIYAGSWYTEALRENPRRPRELKEFKATLKRIAHFEQLLADDGALIVKCWLQLGRSEQRERLRELGDDPRTAWRVTPEDWESHRDYERLAGLSRRLRLATGSDGAPWHVIPAASPRVRNLAVAEQLLASFGAHLRRHSKRAPAGRPAGARSLRPDGIRRLQRLKLDHPLSDSAYEQQRDEWLGRLNALVRTAAARRRSIVWVFEGWDAAGKGGAIRRLTDAIDARDYRVIPIARPSDEEIAHHYLWRFWRHVPRAGMVTIYDRSWYGRVLVERLEGFAKPAEWRRAFAEINDFESQLTGHGIILLKYWLQLSKAEQLRRFRHREETEYKQHKINAEDWRNRRKWEGYEVAVGDMLALTSRPHARWQLIPANNKRHARLEIIKSSCRQIEAALEKA